MAKSIGEGKEEQARLARTTPQMGAQEDTLKSLEQKDFASQVTLAGILAQLNITLSALRDALRGASNKDFTTLETDVEAVLSQLDVVLSTRASETTLATLATEATLATQLNITLSALRDAITDAASPKDLKDLYDELTGLFTNSDLRGSSPAYGAISVANTATLIKASNASRKSIFIQNLGNDNLYVGSNNSVTTVNAGAKIVPGASMEFVYCTSDIYGISDGANIDTRYWESV